MESNKRYKFPLLSVGNLSQWKTSRVKNMSHMFTASHFNGDISAWNVSSAMDSSWMFWESQFNGDISRWNVPGDANMKLMFCGSPLELKDRIPMWYKA